MLDRIRVRSVEYPIVEHCNLSCVHCDHASPLLPARLADLDQYRRDLEATSRVLCADEFRVLGGEPLLHPNLLEFLTIARASNISKVITLVTNGTLLHRAPAPMWKMIDRLWLSVYPKVSLHVSFDDLRRLCEEHGVVLDRRDISSFRQTIINTRIEKPVVVQEIYDHCRLAHEWRCYTVYDGRFYKCAPAPFMRGRLKLRNVDFCNEDDGVKVDGNHTLREELQKYLRSTRPLAACSYCLGSSGFEFPIRQLKKREVLDAIAGDDGPIEALIDHDKL